MNVIEDEKRYNGYKGSVIAAEIILRKEEYLKGSGPYNLAVANKLMRKTLGVFPGLTEEKYWEVIEDFDI